MNEHGKINYIEFSVSDIPRTKQFFSEAFGWGFEDYGPEYSAFSNAGLDGGIFQAEKSSSTDNGAVLVVFYSSDLEQTLGNVKEAGGAIVKDIFEFPGGRRFHFNEPSGNEFAVWSDVSL